MALSVDLEMNVLRAVKFPFKPYASLRVISGGVSMNSSTLVGLGWMCCLVT